MQKITPFLWFDHQAEEAANFYVSVFRNSKIIHVARYGASGAEVSGRKEGSVMTVSFQLDGQDYVALNGGPVFKFSPAISLVINCETQAEVDHFWDQLTTGGEIEQCGWLKDKFGVSWQVVPTILDELVGDPDPKKSERVWQAMLQMTKLEIAKLKEAYGAN